MSRASALPVPIGALDGGPVGFVSPSGDIDVPALALRIGWCVVAEDGLRDPVTSTTRRWSYDGAVAEVALRVHDGDVVLRTFGTRGGLVLEFENATSAACAVGLLVDGDARRVRGGRSVAQSCRGAGREAVVAAISRGDTTVGPPLPSTDHSTSTGLVWPVPHTTTLRVVLDDRDRDPAGAPMGTGPSAEFRADDVRRAWAAQLRRGMSTDIDDRVLQGAVDAARIGLLVRARVGERPDPLVVAALEDWGFDHEAAGSWNRLRMRDRRALRRRHRVPRVAWADMVDSQERGDDVGLLNALRALLLRDEPVVDLLPGFPPGWLGLGVAVHGAPLRGGSASFALRWHGTRPALLWEVPVGTRVCASRLAPGWSSAAATGEALLPEPALELLAHGPTAVAGRAGSTRASPALPAPAAAPDRESGPAPTPTSFS